MRDPYHNARQRFKVARDRYLHLIAGIGDASEYELCKLAALEDFLHIEQNIGYEEEDDVRDAARLLHTMLKWKITDEQQAHMLWKLSRP